MESPQNQQVAEVQYAGFWKRAMAAVIDGAIIGLINGVILCTIYVILFLLKTSTVVDVPAILFSMLLFALDATFVIFGVTVAILSAPVARLALLYSVSEPRNISMTEWDCMVFMVVVFIPTIIINWLYHACLERSSKQATIGKEILGLKVTDLNGKTISFKRATIRHFGKILSSLISIPVLAILLVLSFQFVPGSFFSNTIGAISLFLFGLGFFMAGWTKQKQALHDKVAGCLVIMKSKS